MKYRKKTPRLVLKFIDSDTDEILFEVNDRTWLNVGEYFSDFNVTSIFRTEMKDRVMPKNLMILAVGEFILDD